MISSGKITWALDINIGIKKLNNKNTLFVMIDFIAYSIIKFFDN